MKKMGVVHKEVRKIVHVVVRKIIVRLFTLLTSVIDLGIDITMTNLKKFGYKVSSCKRVQQGEQL